MKSHPVDQAQREEALDPERSFIVQAPAGSGKTGLLVRRFLLLLSRVERPEEILAITFTRKATAEMKHRVLEALEAADQNGSVQLQTANDSDLTAGKQNSDDLACLADAALKRDKEKGWDLLKNPSRLHIQTIDALCYELVRHMPWSSRFGASPSIVEDAETLYQKAATRTLNHIEDQSEWATHCERLLQLVNADFTRARDLVQTMLQKRDRWMRGLESGSREQFESMWQSIIGQQLKRLHQSLSPAQRHELLDLARIGAAELRPRVPDHPLCCWYELEAFPDPVPERLEEWLGLSELVTIKSGSLRKRIDKNIGFPPALTDAKQRLKTILEELVDDPRVAADLSAIRSLPPGTFSDRQWTTMESLLNILPLAAAELRLLFKEQGQTDYVELTQRAEAALGPSEAPSDLALAFDYRLAHILIDEFQDTSKAQIDLLLKLTAGWQDFDGRTLFLVGDPMQSIYRFREAEVSHFLDVQEDGIGQIHPVPLSLQSNFRSAPELVDWFNQTFPMVFPPEDDRVNSAVSYHPATPHCPTDRLAGPHLHTQINGTRQDQADLVCQTVVREIEQDPTGEIAILGRNRAHLHLIAKGLRDAGIRFVATELEPMSHNPAIMDLMALTRAIIQPADRIAWLALLRAPWCGLTLDDMTRLTETEPALTVIETIESGKTMSMLSPSGRKRISGLMSAMSSILTNRGRIPLRQSVESAWMSLCGPALVNHNQLKDCMAFFDVIDQLEDNHALITAERLDHAVTRHWQQSRHQASVQLLTIHKAKGLEFDTVLLPALERTPPPPERELLRWTRLPDALLIALLPPSGETDPFYQFLGELEKSHQHNELARLIYVACTRARRRLHLFALVKTDKKDEISEPPSRSLLQLLWPAWTGLDEAPRLEETGTTHHKSDGPLQTPATGLLRRIGDQFNPPPIPPGYVPQAPIQDTDPMDTARPIADQAIEFDWAGDAARVIGIVVHQILNHIHSMGLTAWSAGDENQQLEQARSALLENGLNLKELKQALEQVHLGLTHLKTDPRAQWIFSPDHTDARSEWGLTTAQEGRINKVIIDRTFVDTEGVRWIIDFKSSRHDESDIDQFVAQEKIRYEQQLNRYARIVRSMDPRPIRLGLYFPTLKSWIEWPYDDS